MPGKVSMYYPHYDTTCRFAAIFEKLAVALGARHFSASAPTMFLRFASPDQIADLEKVQ
jgi:hypothetical protein